MAVQRRALEVEVRCVRARGVLAGGAAYLAPPLLVAEAQAARARIEAVLAIATSASDDINRASNAATAARLLALRRASEDPRTPLRFIQQIPGGHRNARARLTLRLLQSARARAMDACDSVGRCRGHLQTALNLLDNTSLLPGVDGFLEVQRLSATNNLEDALASSVASAALAIVANWLVR